MALLATAPDSFGERFRAVQGHPRYGTMRLDADFEAQELRVYSPPDLELRSGDELLNYYGDAGAFEQEAAARARAEAEFVVRFGFSPWAPLAPSKEGRKANKPSPRAKPRKVATGAELALALAERTETPTLVVYGAKTCRMCRMVQPLLEKVAGKAGVRMLSMTYGKKSDDVYRAYNITATPTVHVHDSAGSLVASEVIYEPSDLPKLADVLARVMS